MTIKAAQLNCKYRAVAEPVSGRVAHVCVLGLCRRRQDQSVVIFPASRSREAATNNNNQTEEAASYTIFFLSAHHRIRPQQGRIVRFIRAPVPISRTRRDTRTTRRLPVFSENAGPVQEQSVCFSISSRRRGQVFRAFPFYCPSSPVLRLTSCVFVCAQKGAVRQDNRPGSTRCVRAFVYAVRVLLLVAA